jgi:uncharacterized membrane protein YedE/YeeE
MEDFPVGALVALLGFGLGLAFGATAQRTNFCTMGAISDMMFMGDLTRFRSWMLAIAVAVLGSQALQIFGAVDLGESIYLTTNLGWAGAILGGLMFGFGMTHAGGCGNKTLVRLGAGSMKSLVVTLVLGIFAYMTLRGLIGPARVELDAATGVDLAEAGLETQGLPDLLAGATGVSLAAMRWVVTLVVGGGLLWFCFKSTTFRASPRHVAAGLIIGALIPVGWFITGVIGFDDFEPTPLASLSFVAPIAEGLVYLMTYTGATINFGIAVVGGIIAGSFLMAVATRTFKIEGFTDTGDMARHVVGGALMGTGGVLAMGCTIGQGITGMSTLALGSLIALLSIIAGGVYGVKYLEEGSFGGAFRAIIARG